MICDHLDNGTFFKSRMTAQWKKFPPLFFLAPVKKHFQKSKMESFEKRAHLFFHLLATQLLKKRHLVAKLKRSRFRYKKLLKWTENLKVAKKFVLLLKVVKIFWHIAFSPIFGSGAFSGPSAFCFLIHIFCLPLSKRPSCAIFDIKNVMVFLSLEKAIFLRSS